MALETGTYISSLNASNPASTDGLAQADDHIRLLKATIKATLPNVTGAITATQAELNLMDGVTATTAELNALDGITSTVAELNILDGVTATAAELNITDGLTATTAQLNVLSGLTATTAELNYVDGVTSNIQTQIDSIPAVPPSQSASTWATGTDTTESLISPSKLKALGDLVDVNGLTSNNYLKIGGLYIQWMTVSFTAQENNIQYGTFPTAFPTACLNCQLVMELNVGASMDGGLYIRNTSTTQVGFQFMHTNASNYGTGTAHILAIGH